MPRISNKYTKQQIKNARQLLLDLSDLYFNPSSEYNDRSSMINTVVYWLDEKEEELLGKT